MRAGASAGGGPPFRGRAPRAAIPFFRRPKRDSENVFFFVPSDAEKQSESDLGFSLAPQLLSSRPPRSRPNAGSGPTAGPPSDPGAPSQRPSPCLPFSVRRVPRRLSRRIRTMQRRRRTALIPPPCKTDIKKLTMRTAGHKTGAKTDAKNGGRSFKPNPRNRPLQPAGRTSAQFSALRRALPARRSAPRLALARRRAPKTRFARTAGAGLTFRPSESTGKDRKKGRIPFSVSRPGRARNGFRLRTRPNGTALSFSCPPFRAQTKHHAGGSPHPQRTATPRASPDSAPRRSSVEEPPRARVCPPCRLRRTTVRPTAARAPRPFPGR